MKQVLLIKGAPDEINRSIGSWGTLNNGYRGKHEQRDVLENGVNMNKMGQLSVFSNEIDKLAE